MPTERDIVDDRDNDDFSSASEVNRLSSALNVSKVVTKRLDALKAGWQEPDDSGRPTARATLEAIKLEAATVTQLANDLLALTRA